MPPNLVEEAIRYAESGLPVFPCQGKKPCVDHGFKDASTDPDTIRAWWKRWPTANIGIPTGPASNLLVLDIDGGAADETLVRLEKLYGALPTTRTIITRPGRFQYWFSYPAKLNIKCSAGRVGQGLDIRAVGGYIIAPPSIHPVSKKPYLVSRNGPTAPPPDWLISLASKTKSTENQATAETSDEHIPQGQRNVALTSLAGTLRTKHFDEQQILAHLRLMNEQRCRPPLPDSELATIAKSIGQKPASGDSQLTIHLESYQQIPKEHLQPMWPGYIPFGRLVHLAGDSGEGKSPLTLDLIARVTSGADWPDGTKNTLGQRSVILLASEDDPNDTIRPRLELAGADLSRVFDAKITKGQDRYEILLALDRDLQQLIAAAAGLPDLALMIIDPITNYLGKVQMRLEEEVRSRLLMPLAKYATDRDICVLTVGHLNRRERGTSPLQRIMGAAAFHGVARFIYFVGSDPDDDHKHAHVLVQQRGGNSPSLRYRTVAQPMSWDDKTSDIIKIEWRGASEATSQDAVDPTSRTERSAEGEAARKLVDILKSGRMASEKAKKLLESSGLKVETLNWSRVLRKAGAKSERFPPERHFSWFLPPHE